MEENKKQRHELLHWKYGLILLGYLLVIFLIYYFGLPVLNFRNPSFYFFLGLVLTIPGALVKYFIGKAIAKKGKDGEYTSYHYNRKKGKFEKIKKDISEKFETPNLLIRGSILPVISAVVLILVFSLIGAKIFNAKAYASQLDITQGSAEDLNTIFDYENGEVLLPEIDKDLAFRLADVCLGDYGSQYTINIENFTLISVNRNGKTELLRVTPLEYATPFVALSQGASGSIGYIEVNVITRAAKLVKVEGGLKYMPSAIFGKDLDRHIRFKYPSMMYEEINFEIDNDGNPYWVIPTIKKEIGIFGGKAPRGVIIVNPVNGDTQYYELGSKDLPNWIQRVVDEKVVEEQANNALTYKNGFFNTLFAKKDVFQLSDGYNYFIKDGKTYYVSCITSPNEGDQTSIGFVIIDLQTKASVRYSTPGITEMRAREIAQGDERVKAQALDSTWPILITYHNVPTFFVVLKNTVQPQKFVLINVSDGTMVAMGDSIEQAKQEYEKLLANKGDIDSSLENKVTAKVTKIRDCGTKIEFMVEGINDKYFEVDVNNSLDARFLQIGDMIEITYKENPSYNLVLSIKKIG